MCRKITWYQDTLGRKKTTAVRQSSSNIRWRRLSYILESICLWLKIVVIVIDYKSPEIGVWTKGCFVEELPGSSIFYPYSDV